MTPTEQADTDSIQARLDAATADDRNCVDQTIFGDKKGNCNSACIATILGLSISEVPSFPVIVPKGQDWQAAQNVWMEQFGVVIFTVILQDDGKLPFMNALVDGIPCIISGKSPRGDFDHAVVGSYRLDAERGHSLEYIHDPHPSRKFLDKAKSVDFFIAIKPIAHAPTDIAALLDKVKRLEGVVEAQSELILVYEDETDRSDYEDGDVPGPLRCAEVGLEKALTPTPQEDTP